MVIKRTAVLGIIAILISSSSTNADVIGSATLAFTLNHLMDQVQQAIEAARNAGLTIELEAGREAAIAIQNAQNAYASDLNLTMDRVDNTTRRTVDQLNTLVTDVSRNAFSNLNDVAGRVQQIVNSLPFRDHQPQLTRVSPRFVVPAINTYPAVIHLNGNFEAASEPGYAPKLQIGDKAYDTSYSSTQELQFAVPVSELFSGALDSKFNFTTVTATVPWKACSVKFIWCWSTKKEMNTYKLFLGALPASPGKLTLQWQSTHSQRNTKQIHTNEIYQTSASDGANHDHKDVPYQLRPEPGWHILQGSSRLDESPGSTEGDRSETFISDAGDVVEYHVTTIHHGIGTAGRVHFTIYATEYQDVSVADPINTTDYSLKWGDSKAINQNGGTWTMLFDAFDGSHSEFTGADQNNRFVQIRNSGGSYTVGTADPATLLWP